MRKFSTVAVTLGIALGVVAAHSEAQAPYPNRPIRLVVPLAAGGPTDQLARSVAQDLSSELGQPVVVENKPGADGMVAARDVSSAPPDGHTMLFAIGSMLAAPLMSPSLGIDWQAAFASVGKVGRMTFCMMVGSEVPARTVAEFVEYARANPGKLAFATSTLSELMAASQLMQAAGVGMTRVSYRGGPRRFQTWWPAASR
jgi:tripartite-type tricarboxylate transporter receptor subunit TctC